jgi:hypothetical protein
MYTSGCPKNQNKCWYKMGLPPPAGSKKEVLKLRSVRSIVIAPANTGNLVINKRAVIANAHSINGIFLKENLLLIRLHRIVVKKLILPMIEEAPAK